MTPAPSTEHQLIADMIALIRKHYPDGRMPADEAVVVFGLVLAGALSCQPENVRDHAARTVALRIRHPPQALKRFVSAKDGNPQG